MKAMMVPPTGRRVRWMQVVRIWVLLGRGQETVDWVKGMRVRVVGVEAVEVSRLSRGRCPTGLDLVRAGGFRVLTLGCRV